MSLILVILDLAGEEKCICISLRSQQTVGYQDMRTGTAAIKRPMPSCLPPLAKTKEETTACLLF